MTFEQLYEQAKGDTGARPMDFLRRVAVAAIVSIETAYQWGVGLRIPSHAAAALVAKELGTPAEELFPRLRKKQIS